MKVSFAPIFVKRLAQLNSELQKEVIEKVDLLKSPSNFKTLKVHKLHGKLKNRWSFSVNYKTRIIFSHLTKNEIILLAIGDHSIYDK